MNRISIQRLALGALAALLTGALPAQSEEVLVYKLAAARRWQQDSAYYPDSANPQLRNSIAGTFNDTSYLVLNRTTKEMVMIDYYQFTEDGGRYRVYEIERGTFADWNKTFPANTSYEYQIVQAPRSGTQTVSLKSGFQTIESADLNADGFPEDIASGELWFLRGGAGPRRLSAQLTLNQVAGRLTGVKREFSTTEYGPLGSSYGIEHYRGGGTQTATLDAPSTLAATNLVPTQLTNVRSTIATDILQVVDVDTNPVPHGLNQGDLLTFVSGTVPPLVATTQYHVIRVNATSFKLATSAANAAAGTAIDLITANGTGAAFQPTQTPGAVAIVEGILSRLGYDNLEAPAP